MPTGRASLAIILLLVGLSLFLVFVPVPFSHVSTFRGCEHHLPPNALFGCSVGMGGYGSVTYDLFGYGGFLGPIGQYDVYNLFF
jgi:hypothetical protein